MDKTRENNILKILAGVLPVLIVLTLIVGSVLVSAAGGSTPGDPGETAKTAEPETIKPKEDELKIVDSITVTASGTSGDEADSGEKPEDEDPEDYILPDSNTKLLKEPDIKRLSAQDLNYARNEIYARHGRKFSSKELQEYFESKSWYQGKYEGKDFDSNYGVKVLSDIEKKNSELLKKAEYKKASGGYKLE
ncbi:YARHG domain-containing protein [Muricomes intestini]|uniref:YARHG domain-containing protein n=1 Tax=Muricomes intestini TaxID=1796634 RepID=A0A4V2USQ9_9FIRM|nr:YARHG domain-containing protein [Muricomes intestini]TCS82372.1 YARHG domain-containing protein [Muricomes intestini]HAX53594.1 hypothetical protein [Lachnospiraceae bacterium]HCR84996.1 hypothetical protein [Lachnospiraceae bacterium]